MRCAKVMFFLLPVLLPGLAPAQGVWEWQNPLPQGRDLNGVSFYDTNRGMAVGVYGTILRTTDIGDGWEVIRSGTEQHLHGVSLVDTGVATVVGRGGTILRTTDGGAFWTQVLDDDAYSVDFRDALHGVAGSRYDPWVWVTDDGGISWEKVEYPWANDPLDVAAVPDGFVTCGYASVILRGFDWSTSVEPAPVTAENALVRISPNPFNPNTRIPYELAGGAEEVRVELQILDLRGRAVRTLVSSRQVAGQRHEALWDGRNDRGQHVPSGTYLAHLRVGGRSQARFLTLVK